MTSKKIFITGASGFIGHHLVNKLSSLNMDVFACSRTNNTHRASVLSKNIDILNRHELEDALSTFQPDCIIHLAAIASPASSQVSEIYNVNVAGTENLLESAIKIQSKKTKIILASTAGVYGNSIEAFIPENADYNPQNHYSYSKMIMEYIAQRYKDRCGIKIVRPFNVIGYGQKENFLIPKLVKAFVERQKILQVGNIDTVRDYVDIDFATEFFYKLIIEENSNFNVINLCSGKGTSGKDILQMLQNLTKYSPKIEINKEFLRAYEVMRLVGDNTKCKTIMGENKTLQIEQILQNMINQYSK